MFASLKPTIFSSHCNSVDVELDFIKLLLFVLEMVAFYSIAINSNDTYCFRLLFNIFKTLFLQVSIDIWSDDRWHTVSKVNIIPQSSIFRWIWAGLGRVNSQRNIHHSLQIFNPLQRFSDFPKYPPTMVQYVNNPKFPLRPHAACLQSWVQIGFLFLVK